MATFTNPPPRPERHDRIQPAEAGRTSQRRRWIAPSSCGTLLLLTRDCMDEQVVVIARAPQAAYPSRPPFHPDEAYPESFFRGVIGEEPNFAYRAVRQALVVAG